MAHLLDDAADIRRALQRVGELLDAAGESFAIIIVGGAALNLLNVVSRATRDVDIVAFARRRARSWRPMEAPADLPAPLALAVTTDAELTRAARWVKRQDAGALFPRHVDEVVERIRANRHQR